MQKHICRLAVSWKGPFGVILGREAYSTDAIDVSVIKVAHRDGSHHWSWWFLSRGWVTKWQWRILLSLSWFCLPWLISFKFYKALALDRRSTLAVAAMADVIWHLFLNTFIWLRTQNTKMICSLKHWQTWSWNHGTHHKSPLHAIVRAVLQVLFSKGAPWECVSAIIRTCS